MNRLDDPFLDQEYEEDDDVLGGFGLTPSNPCQSSVPSSSFPSNAYFPSTSYDVPSTFYGAHHQQQPATCTATVQSTQQHHQLPLGGGGGYITAIHHPNQPTQFMMPVFDPSMQQLGHQQVYVVQQGHGGQQMILQPAPRHQSVSSPSVIVSSSHQQQPQYQFEHHELVQQQQHVQPLQQQMPPPSSNDHSYATYNDAMGLYDDGSEDAPNFSPVERQTPVLRDPLIRQMGRSVPKKRSSIEKRVGETDSASAAAGRRISTEEGWKSMNGWLRAAEQDVNKLLQLLGQCREAKVTVNLLRSNDTPRFIRKLSKNHKDEEVRALSLSIVTKWKKVVNTTDVVEEKKEKKVIKKEEVKEEEDESHEMKPRSLPVEKRRMSDDVVGGEKKTDLKKDKEHRAKAKVYQSRGRSTGVYPGQGPQLPLRMRGSSKTPFSRLLTAMTESGRMNHDFSRRFESLREKVVDINANRGSRSLLITVCGDVTIVTGNADMAFALCRSDYLAQMHEEPIFGKNSITIPLIASLEFVSTGDLTETENLRGAISLILDHELFPARYHWKCPRPEWWPHDVDFTSFCKKRLGNGQPLSQMRSVLSAFKQFNCERTEAIRSLDKERIEKVITMRSTVLRADERIGRQGKRKKRDQHNYANEERIQGDLSGEEVDEIGEDPIQSDEEPIVDQRGGETAEDVEEDIDYGRNEDAQIPVTQSTPPPTVPTLKKTRGRLARLAQPVIRSVEGLEGVEGVEGVVGVEGMGGRVRGDGIMEGMEGIGGQGRGRGRGRGRGDAFASLSERGMRGGIRRGMGGRDAISSGVGMVRGRVGIDHSLTHPTVEEEWTGMGNGKERGRGRGRGGDRLYSLSRGGGMMEVNGMGRGSGDRASQYQSIGEMQVDIGERRGDSLSSLDGRRGQMGMDGRERGRGRDEIFERRAPFGFSLSPSSYCTPLGGMVGTVDRRKRKREEEVKNSDPDDLWPREAITIPPPTESRRRMNQLADKIFPPSAQPDLVTKTTVEKEETTTVEGREKAKDKRAAQSTADTRQKEGDEMNDMDIPDISSFVYKRR